MVGTSDIPFSGTFDGQGHTLTVNYQNNTSDLWAPFRFVKNATIRNLHVNGTIKITQQFAAGIVAKVVKDGNVSIENCHSSVTIERESTSSSVFYAYYAGFVAKNDNSSLTITGCIFDGTLKAHKSSTTRKGCGFVGSNYGTVSITNSLFKPSSILNIKSDHSYTFCPNTDGTVTITNSYYTKTLGTAQGTQAYVYTPATDSFVPANVGEPIANGTYSVSGITAYSDGLKRDADFYMVKASVSLADNDDNSTAIIDKQVADVTLSGRTLYKDGDWNTICLPFDVTLSGRPLAGATARTLTSASISGTTMNLTFGDAVDELVAGRPYIIKWENGDNIINPVFEGVTVDKTEHNFTSGSGDTQVRFLGTYKSKTFTGEDKSILFLGEDNMLYYPQPDIDTENPENSKFPTIGACRAYFKIGDGDALARQITAFNLDFGDSSESTGIREIYTDPAPSPSPTGVGRSAWYSLDGRKLDGKPTKSGVYIREGKKVIVK